MIMYIKDFKINVTSNVRLATLTQENTKATRLFLEKWGVYFEREDGNEVWIPIRHIVSVEITPCKEDELDTPSTKRILFEDFLGEEIVKEEHDDE